jgi:hypothetical protein
VSYEKTLIISHEVLYKTFPLCDRIKVHEYRTVICFSHIHILFVLPSLLGTFDVCRWYFTPICVEQVSLDISITIHHNSTSLTHVSVSQVYVNLASLSMTNPVPRHDCSRRILPQLSLSMTLFSPYHKKLSMCGVGGLGL